jgi:hypothetical protein
MQYLFFWAWLISLNMMISSSIHFPINDTISFLYGWVIFHGIHISYFIYAFIGCWVPWLIPQGNYYEESCNKHGYAGICPLHWFRFPPVLAQLWLGKVIR